MVKRNSVVFLVGDRLKVRTIRGLVRNFNLNFGYDIKVNPKFELGYNQNAIFTTAGCDLKVAVKWRTF